MAELSSQLPHRSRMMGGTRFEEDVGLSEILAIVRRRLREIGMIVAPILGITAVGLWMATPRYSAETLIMIEVAGNRFMSAESVAAGLSGDEASVQSEIQVLGSRALADRVVQRLELDRDPEFADPEVDTSTVAGYSGLIDRYLDRLTVMPMTSSRVIGVQFSSVDAEKSATVANAIADEYLLWRLERKFEETRRATGWLSENIAELSAEVAADEAEVERVRSDYGLLQGEGMTLASNELIELNTQLVMAKTARAEAEARFAQVQAAAGNDADSAVEVLESTLIQNLRQQEAEVERRVAELSSELGERHPRMIQLRAEARDLRDRIDREVDKIIAGLRNRVEIARARESSIARSVEELKDKVKLANRNEIELRALEREAQANRVMLDSLLARQKQAMSQEDLGFQKPDATIVSAADVPAEPTYPRTKIVLGIAFIGSLMLALLAVLLLELVDSGFRSGEHFERHTGVPALGFVPLVPLDPNRPSLVKFLNDRPGSAFGESIRTLDWSLKLACPDAHPRVVLVTSSMPGEGKTSIASCLAAAVAAMGRSTLLIDADLRQPSCHWMAGLPRSPGLSEVLVDECLVDDAIKESRFDGLHVLPAGRESRQGPNLLGSDAAKSLIEDLRERYEFVLIDSPPVLAGADALILSQLVDTTVFVVHWGKTRRKVVRHALDQLIRAGAPLAGGLLSRVDVRRNSMYTHGDSGVYGGELAKYYGDRA